MKREPRSFRFFFWVSTLLAYSCVLLAQSYTEERFSILSFNVENLFDTIPDSLYKDKEFVPWGKKQWNAHRYYRKLRLIAEAISLGGGLEWPWLIALQEVENEGVLRDLVSQTAIASARYQPIVSRGADNRGMRVALLYAEGLFVPESVSEWRIPTPKGYLPRSSRPILAVRGLLLGRYPIRVVVVHLPSNRQGRKESQPYRREAFYLLRAKCDSLSRVEPSTPLVVIGDFNSSSHEVDYTAGWVVSFTHEKPIETDKLYDVSQDRSPESLRGSYYFRKAYTQIDRLLLSPHFFVEEHPESIIIYEKGSFANCPLAGKMKALPTGIQIPFRTFGGDSYIGGTSDHVPIKATFSIVSQ